MSIDRNVFRYAEARHLPRFLSQVLDDGAHWFWTGRLSAGGYGLFSIHGQTVGAHRVAYEWHHGPMFSWMETDHLCRQPACVNPDHMEAVTHLENVRRGKVAEAIRASQHPLAKYLFTKAVSISSFATSMRTNPNMIHLMLRGHRPQDPDLVYRIGDAIGLTWEETDHAFRRRSFSHK